MLLIAAIMLVAVAAAIYHYREIRSLDELRHELHFDDGMSPRLSISVVVSGTKDVDYISALLKQEASSFEVVVVGDFKYKEQLLQTIKHHFSLIRVNYTAVDNDLSPSAIRALYRSHRKLFSRVVVVDSPSSKSYSPFEVGAHVSRYDYNLQIYSRRTLRPQAIGNLLLELSIAPEGEIETIVSSCYEKFQLVRREVALGLLPINRSKKKGIKYRILK